MQLFVNFTMLCSCLYSSVFEMLIGCCLGNVGVLLAIIVLNEEYFLTMILSDWLTDWPTEPFTELLPQLKTQPCCAVDYVQVSLRCWWDVVGVLLTIIVLNEEYFLTMILSDWPTDWPTEPFPELLPQLKTHWKHIDAKKYLYISYNKNPSKTYLS